MVWIGFIWLSIGTTGRFYEHGIELLDSIKCWETLEQLQNWRFLKKGLGSMSK
jgi:hypothetical protein